MVVYLGLGSNIEDRRDYLQKAIQLLNEKLVVRKRSSIYESPALLPEQSPEDWNHPFLNMVLKVESDKGVRELFQWIQEIEKKLGRDPKHDRWSPRTIDIDILAIENHPPIQEKDLVVPHPSLTERDFVLSPLKEVVSTFQLNGESVLSLSRQLPHKIPAWMDIFNFTPDSFSDGGWLFPSSDKDIYNKIKNNIEHNVQWIDVGGFSTRPGAVPVSVDEEWNRIKPFFDVFKKFHKNSIKVSVDTFRAEVAEKSLKQGAAAINDVSGLSDDKMLELLKSSECEYILMHSLSIPADRNQTIDTKKDVVHEIQNWLESRLETLSQSHIDLNRIIFDPGIGFGKTAQQSLELLQQVDQFMKYPVRVMVGHSRKSFMSIFSKKPAQERNLESVGVSLNLAQKGVDIIRVHEALKHARAWLAYKHTH